MPKVPKYRKHVKGYAFIEHFTIRTRDHRMSLGKYGSPESIEKYQAFLGGLAGIDRDDELEEADDKDGDPPMYVGSIITVQGVAAMYLKHARQHYKREGGISREYEHMKQAISPLVRKYGMTVAKRFGPKRLKRVRRILIKRGLARKHINHMVSRIKRVFRWASEEEVVPPGLYHRLTCVRGLYRGQFGCTEKARVKAAPIDSISALLPFLPPNIADLLLLQLYCGMRPGEACAFRMCDVDTSGPIWLYRPQTHKNLWRGIEEIKAIPPIAQEIIKHNQRPDRAAYLFSPKDAAAWCMAQRIVGRPPRKTKRYPSEIRRVEKETARRRRRKRKQLPGDCYDTTAYCRALSYAFDRAAKAGVKIQRFTPNQIRHTILTFVGQRLGQQAAQRWGGHEDMDTTAIYTERQICELVEIAHQVNAKLLEYPMASAQCIRLG